MVIVTLPFPVSTNSLYANGKTGRFKSARYEAWLQEAGYALMVQRPKRTKGPVTLECRVQDAKDGRKRDITNMIKGAEDFLVKNGVIDADDHTVVRAVSLAWSKEVEGIEIKIIPTGEDQ